MSRVDICIYEIFSVCPSSPLSPLVPDRELSNPGSNPETRDQGEMTRVDQTLVGTHVAKIKELLPEGHIFRNFTVKSDSVLKLLSTAQRKDVTDMLAKATYVR